MIHLDILRMTLIQGGGWLNMTLKEKVAQIQPDMIDEDLSGGVDGCPGDYHYLNKFGLDVTACNRNISCKDCWNQKFNPKLKSITWAKLWKKIGKQPIRKTQNKKVEILIDGKLKECALVFTDNGSKFHLEIVE